MSNKKVNTQEATATQMISRYLEPNIPSWFEYLEPTHKGKRTMPHPTLEELDTFDLYNEDT